MTYSGISKELLFALEQRALNQMREVNALEKFTSKEKMPKASGAELKFHYYDEIPTSAIVDLVEGVSPAETDLVRVSLSGTIQDRGTSIPYTSQLMERHQDTGELVSEMSKELGYTMGRKIEEVGFEIAVAGAGTVIPLTSLDASMKAVAKAMRLNNAPKFTEIKKGSANSNTFPIAAGWYGFVNVEDADLFRALADFLPVEDYGYSDKIFPNEIGVIKSLGLRIIDTLNLAAGNAVFLAEDGLASVGLAGNAKAEIIHKPLGSSGSLDPINQRGSVGVKSSTQMFVKRSERVICAELV